LTSEDVAPSTLTSIRIGISIIDATNAVDVATNSTNDLTNVERRESMVISVARSVAISRIRTHQAAVERSLSSSTREVVLQSSLATVLPTPILSLVTVAAKNRATNVGDASVEVADPLLLESRVKTNNAAKTKRRSLSVRELVTRRNRFIVNAEVGDVSLMVDVAVIASNKEVSQVTESTISVRTH